MNGQDQPLLRAIRAPGPGSVPSSPVSAKAYMTKAEHKTVVRTIRRKREQIASLREDLESLNDYLDLVAARAQDEGKPRLTHDQVKRRYGLR